MAHSVHIEHEPKSKWEPRDLGAPSKNPGRERLRRETPRPGLSSQNGLHNPIDDRAGCAGQVVGRLRWAHRAGTDGCALVIRTRFARRHQRGGDAACPAVSGSGAEVRESGCPELGGITVGVSVDVRDGTPDRDAIASAVTVASRSGRST